MSGEGKRINVAIACQGGGAQTAFTAGALSWLIKKYQEQGEEARFRIVALSGTSGGAVSAALAWRDLLLANGREHKVPTVEQFWKSAYPEGNAALPFMACVWEDLEDFLWHGHLPWLRTTDRLRNSVALLSGKACETAFAMTPVQAIIELQPFYFERIFRAMDTTPPGWAANEAFKLVGRRLRTLRDIPLPGTRHAANFVGDILDMVPFHAGSVIREDEPALIRREFDVQDALTTVLARYFNQSCLSEIKAQIDARRKAGELVPELLIGATDAERVEDARDRSTQTGQSAEVQDPEVEKVKAKALALEEHEHHRASFSNFRVFRGTERLDQIVACVAASAAIPTLMRGVALDKTTLWDGLYSSNPPIYDLPDVHRARGQENYDPDEIWVIRINPVQTWDRPDTASEIADRRNELAGNLPLTQEIRNVIQIGGLKKGDRYYKPITFGFIDMSERIAADLEYDSKINKGGEQIDMLFNDGCYQMQSFYKRWLDVTVNQQER